MQTHTDLQGFHQQLVHYVHKGVCEIVGVCELKAGGTESLAAENNLCIVAIRDDAYKQIENKDQVCPWQICVWFHLNRRVSND